MLAAVQTAYGGPEVVVVREVSKPVPKAGEVLVRVVASTVTSGDSRLRAFRVPAAFWLPARLFLGISKPRKTVLGSEYAGTVEAVGDGVTRFKAGDRVFGMHVYDCHAQYKVVPEASAILPLPDGLNFEESASIPFGALTAHYFLRQAGIKAGSTVLVNGASGAVGAYGVQLARQMGATVTAVCSAGNAEFVQALGADEVIDYRTTDLSTLGRTWDVIMDTVDTVSTTQFDRATPDKGVLLAVNAGGAMFARAAMRKLSGGKTIVTGMATEKRDDLAALVPLFASGALKPVIGRTFPLADIAAAHALVDSGRKRGAAVIILP